MSAGLPFSRTPGAPRPCRPRTPLSSSSSGRIEPVGFNATITFLCADRDEIASRVEFAAGRATRWTGGADTDDVSGAWLRAPLQVWRTGAAGAAEFSKLLVGRGVRLRDTRRKDIASNYRALDALVASWVLISTDWEPSPVVDAEARRGRGPTRGGQP